MPVSSNASERYSRPISDVPKKLWPSNPTNYNHKREVAAELTPEELAEI